MRQRTVIAPRGFKKHRLFAIVAVFALVCLLFMIEKVAEMVVTAGNSAGINMPPVPVFRQASADLFMVATGLILLMVSAFVLVPIVKFAVIGAGFALLGYGLFQVYKLIQGKPVSDLLPKK